MKVERKKKKNSINCGTEETKRRKTKRNRITVGEREKEKRDSFTSFCIHIYSYTTNRTEYSCPYFTYNWMKWLPSIPVPFVYQGTLNDDSFRFYLHCFIEFRQTPRRKLFATSEDDESPMILSVKSSKSTSFVNQTNSASKTSNFLK